MKAIINIVQTSEGFMNSVKSKSLGYDLAEDWMFFWTFFMPIALILNFFSKDIILIYKGLIYIIFIFIMTLIRRNIVGSFRYILANFFMIFITFIISFTLIEKVVFLVPMILCFIFSIKKRKSEIIEFYKINMLLWQEILMVICYFIAFNYRLTFMMNLINFASINVAITCTLYVYISRVNKIIEGEFIKQYARRIKNIKLSCITFISVVIIFFIFLADRIGLYKLFDSLTSRILALLSVKQSNEASPITKASTNTHVNHSISDQFKKLKYTGKNSNLMTTILNIIQLIMFAAVTLLVIYLLFRIFIQIKNFYKGLSLKKTYKKEKREFVISPDDIVKVIKDKGEKFKAGIEIPFNMSNDKKIRKLYQKLIKSYKTKETLACKFNTPVEIECKIRKVLEQNVSEATVIYEKARYCDSKCSKEDVDKMKSFLKL